MDVRHLLAALFLLTGLPGVADARCLDQAAARLGYKFQDSQGAVGEVQFNGAEETVLMHSGGREIRQTYTNDGQVMTDFSVVTGKDIVHQTITFQMAPVLLDSVGQSAEFGSISRTDVRCRP